MKTAVACIACLFVGFLAGTVVVPPKTLQGQQPTAALEPADKTDLREDQVTAAIIAWVRAKAEPTTGNMPPMEMQVQRSTQCLLVSGVVSGPAPGVKTGGAWIVIAAKNGGPIVMPYPPAAPAQDHLPTEEELAKLDAPKLLKLYQFVRQENQLLRELNQVQKDKLSNMHQVFWPRKKVIDEAKAAAEAAARNKQPVKAP